MARCIKLFRKFFSAVLLLALSKTLFSQEYIPMNFKDGIWFEEYDSFMDKIEEITKFCCGDTTIGNLLYYKLYEEKLVSPIRGDHYYTTSSIIGFIRNSADKTVQYIPTGGDQPITIYDFNIDIGDTIKGEWYSIDDIRSFIVVKVIDSVEISGRYHKRYSEFGTGYPGDCSPLHLIEGIGYSNGLLGYSIPFVVCGETMYYLSGYSECSDQDSTCDNCNLLSLKVSNDSYQKLNIYPNPFHGHLTIRSDRTVTAITVYDIYGKVVYEENSLFTTNKIVQTGNLPPGLYFILVQFADRSFYSVKAMKIR